MIGRRLLTAGAAMALVLAACAEDDPSSETAGQNELPASDTGVTAKSILVGFTVLDLSGLEAQGLEDPAGLRQDTREFIQAMVDSVNEDGGINGRLVEPVMRDVDFLTPEDQTAECLGFTEDDQVFAVIDSSSYNLPESRACVTQQGDTLLIAGIAGTDQEVADSFPNLVSMRSSETGTVRDTILGAEQEGFFDAENGFERLGVVTHSCRQDDLVNGEGGLDDLLAEVGVEDYSSFEVECSVEGEQAGGEPAVLDFKEAGVTNVMVLTGNNGVAAFTNAAEDQDFQPTYFGSDYSLSTEDVNSTIYQPDQYDGTVAYTQLNREDPSQYPGVQACDEILEGAGLPLIDDYAKNVEINQLCDSFRLFVAGARAAGAELTHDSWYEGFTTIGEFEGATVNHGTFDTPGEVTGAGDRIAKIVWSKDCTCWELEGEFEPGFE